MYGKFVNGTSTNSAKCGVSIAAFLCYSLCNINHDDNNYNNNNNKKNNDDDDNHIHIIFSIISKLIYQNLNPMYSCQKKVFWHNYI